MNDRSITLVIICIIILCVAALAAIVKFAVSRISRRRRTTPTAVAKALTEIRLFKTMLPDNRRAFYEGGELPELRKVKQELKRLAGASLLFERVIPGPNPIWTLKFTYCGHEFEIEMNYHAAVSIFMVSDPECPDALLREVAWRFDKQS